ncbi:phenylalanine 4-monooxygenase [Pedobacter psychrophilus]|uniref:Phenylalanine 4-monooxygenase n=1 Tax=Pedobacter psychrophilus TaxID=1826909 RepID=A0A179DBA3_9SPHI|nr:phenylalanine 4-monooxygenase [Pedobacter psychrophilus]
MDDFNNSKVKKLPNHLRQYIVDQNYENYTSINHAVWRYVMRQNYSYLKNVAYYPYIKGLARAGLSIENIPDLQTMNDNLGKIGWGAVTVDGFIPPVAFMEFQAYQVLVIAADIRQINHIAYTPAPDIIHESAGHAPIIADEAYNNYLSYFGSIGAKAMFSSKDYQLYEAIRKLSILKEDINAHPADIKKAEQKVNFCQENLGDPSEMALLSRLHWYTVEYGLIGTLEDPKIYGAGLLSSIGESASCMQKDVKKLWYNFDTINYSYDITKTQPQLFVTPNFQNLIDVLEAFADTMAFRKGGTESVLKAIECKKTCTAVYSSGLQISGVFTDIGMSKNDELHFIKTTGTSALSHDNKQLQNHGKDFHKDGFSSPVGKLKNEDKCLENFGEKDLEKYNILKGNDTNIEFESGISVSGKVKSLLFKNDKLLLISFDNCTVTTKENQILFKPEFGVYDMAVGEKIVSVFCGAADKDAFEEIAHVSKTQTKKVDYSKKQLELQQLYQETKLIRLTENGIENVERIFNELKKNHREDWLCCIELLEILNQHQINISLQKDIKIYLEMKASNYQELKKLIEDGIKLIDNPVIQLTIKE